ncbi:MAG: hypothetical protein NVS4B11_25290 [Ktedonobacteraceae bacterium]
MIIKVFFADHVPMIIRPSSDLRIQLGNEIVSGGLLVLSDDFSNTFQKNVNVLSRRRDEQFPVVLTQVLPILIAMDKFT